MSEPAGFTLDWYDRLPGLYRDVDAAGHLLAFMRLLGDVAGEVEDLADLVEDTLADPASAQAAWLAWLGQFVGVRRGDYPTEADMRTAIASSAAGRLGGSQEAMAALIERFPVASGSTEDPAVTFEPIHNGDPFVFKIYYRAYEVTEATVLELVNHPAVKPAGFIILVQDITE